MILRRAAALLVAGAGGASAASLVSTASWGAAPGLLRSSGVSAVCVGDAAPALESSFWDDAADGSAIAVVDVADPERSLAAVAAAFEPLAPCDCCAGAAAAAAAPIVAVAEAFDACLGEERRDGRVRVKVSVVGGGGRGSQPCPKLHTDNVPLRCIVALRGPPTVVAPGASLSGSRLLPSWLARGDGAAALVTPDPGDALLLKGTTWGPLSRAAAHRSPAPTGARRVLLVVDRLRDVT